MNHKPSPLTSGVVAALCGTSLLSRSHPERTTLPEPPVEYEKPPEPEEWLPIKSHGSIWEDPGVARWFNDNCGYRRRPVGTKTGKRPQAEKKARALKRKNTRRNRNK